MGRPMSSDTFSVLMYGIVFSIIMMGTGFGVSKGIDGDVVEDKRVNDTRLANSAAKIAGWAGVTLMSLVVLIFIADMIRQKHF